MQLEHPEIDISTDILYRKYAAFKNGDIEGLIDKRGGWNKGHTDIPKHILDAFLYFYLDERRLPVSPLLSAYDRVGHRVLSAGS